MPNRIHFGLLLIAIFGSALLTACSQEQGTTRVMLLAPSKSANGPTVDQLAKIEAFNKKQRSLLAEGKAPLEGKAARDFLCSLENLENCIAGPGDVFDTAAPYMAPLCLHAFWRNKNNMYVYNEAYAEMRVFKLGKDGTCNGDLEPQPVDFVWLDFKLSKGRIQHETCEKNWSCSWSDTQYGLSNRVVCASGGGGWGPRRFATAEQCLPE